MKNLNFEANDDSLREHFFKLGSVKSGSVARKVSAKDPDKLLPRGYGFVECTTQSCYGGDTHPQTMLTMSKYSMNSFLPVIIEKDSLGPLKLSLFIFVALFYSYILIKHLYNFVFLLGFVCTFVKFN